MQARSVVMLVPPPVVYVGAFAIGLLIERWLPSPRHLVVVESGAISHTPVVVAVLLIATGAVWGPLNAIRFLLQRTTLNPNKPARVFLTRGVYAVSRNPMYVGLFLIYVGVAIVKGSMWPIATMTIPFVLLDRIVIPFEEARMRETFGSMYGAYCARVRRWLTLTAP